MQNLNGLRGLELVEAYKENLLEFDKVMATYVVGSVSKHKQHRSIHEGIYNSAYLAFYRCISLKCANALEKEYKEYVWFYPRRGEVEERVKELSVFAEGYLHIPGPGVRRTVTPLKRIAHCPVEQTAIQLEDWRKEVER